MADQKKLPPICPRFTRLGAPSPLDPNQTTKLQIVRCQGPDCAIFVIDFDEKGKPTGTGHCAEVIEAIMSARLAAAVEAIAANIIDDDEPEEEPTAPASA